MTFGSTPYEGERVDFHSMSSSPSYLQWTSSKLDRTASKLRAILDDKGKLQQLVAEKRQKLPRYYPSSAAGAVAVGVSVLVPSWSGEVPAPSLEELTSQSRNQSQSVRVLAQEVERLRGRIEEAAQGAAERRADIEIAAGGGDASSVDDAAQDAPGPSVDKDDEESVQRVAEEVIENVVEDAVSPADGAVAEDGAATPAPKRLRSTQSGRFLRAGHAESDADATAKFCPGCGISKANSEHWGRRMCPMCFSLSRRLHVSHFLADAEFNNQLRSSSLMQRARQLLAYAHLVVGLMLPTGDLRLKGRRVRLTHIRGLQLLRFDAILLRRQIKRAIVAMETAESTHQCLTQALQHMRLALEHFDN